jgi:hypothetical protein
MIKGLMTEAQAKLLFDKFSSIKLFHRRTSNQFPSGQDSLSLEQLLELDIDFEIYEEILESEGTELVLISHSQGLMVTEYRTNRNDSDINVGDRMMESLLELVSSMQFSKDSKCIIINNLGKSISDYPYNEKVQNVFGPGVRTSTRNPTSEQLYRNFESDVAQNFMVEADLLSSLQMLGRTLQNNLQVTNASRVLRVLTVSKASNMYGITFKAEIYFNVGKYLKDISNDENFSIQGNGKTTFSNKYKIIKTIDLNLDEFDFTPYISKEAIPLFIKWVRKTVKKRSNLNGPNIIKDAVVHKLDVSKIDSKYSTKFNQILGQQIPSKSFFNQLFVKFDYQGGGKSGDLNRQMNEIVYNFFNISVFPNSPIPPSIYRPKDNKLALGKNIIKGLESFRDTVLKYKPLSVEFFTSDKYKEGRANFFTTIRARINIAMGTRTTLSGKQMITGGRKVEPSRPLGFPRPKEGLSEEKTLFKQMKPLPELIKNAVKMANRNGYDALDDEQKKEMAEGYANWVANQFDRGYSNVKISPATPTVIENLSKIAGILPRYMGRSENMTIFRTTYQVEKNIPPHLLQRRVVIVNYESQEIYVVNIGRYDDARYFSVSFQDFDIRMDLINVIHRVARKPEASPVVENKNFMMNQTPQNRSLEHALPSRLNENYINNENHVYSSNVKRDKLTGNVSGYTVFREKDFKTYMVFPFDNFYHDKEGHRDDKMDVCFTPLTSPLGHRCEQVLAEMYNKSIKLEAFETEVRLKTNNYVASFLADVRSSRDFNVLKDLITAKLLQEANGNEPNLSKKNCQKISERILIELIAKHEPASYGLAFCILTTENFRYGVDMLMMFGMSRNKTFPFHINAFDRTVGGQQNTDNEQARLRIWTSLLEKDEEEIISFMNKELGKNFERNQIPVTDLARRGPMGQ